VPFALSLRPSGVVTIIIPIGPVIAKLGDGLDSLLV